MGQLADEPDRIAEEKFFIICKVNFTNWRIQGCKEHIFDKDLLIFLLSGKLQKTIHGSWFAGIGIPHQGHLGQTRSPTLLTLGYLVFLHIFEFFTQLGDLFFNYPPV